MFVPIDRDSAVALPRQIATYLEELIRCGHVAPGSSLPPTRALARDTGVSRKTVEAAYDQLEERGLVQIRAGQGVSVRRRLPPNPEPGLPFRARRVGDPLPAEAWPEPHAVPAAEVDFAGHGARVLHWPSRSLRAFHHAALDRRGVPLFRPAPALGEAELRRAAARQFARCGVLRSDDEVVIFASREDATRCVLGWFPAERGPVVLESLVDPEIGRALTATRSRTQLAAATPAAARRAVGRGARLLILRGAESRVAAPESDWLRRRELADAARDHGVPVLEDVTGLDRSLPPTFVPFSATERSGRGFALCDLSDEVGGGFAATALTVSARALEQLRQSPPPPGPPRLTQLVLAAVLDAPRRRRHRVDLEEQRRLLEPGIKRTLRRRLPELTGFEFSRAADAVRLDLPADVSAAQFVRAAAAASIAIVAPTDCGAPRSRDDFVWLDLTRHEEGELLDGIRRLGEVFDGLGEDVE